MQLSHSDYARETRLEGAYFVGSPQQIIDKLLYQHELFGHGRFLAQVDLGGLPYDKVAQTMTWLARDDCGTASERERRPINSITHQVEVYQVTSASGYGLTIGAFSFDVPRGEVPVEHFGHAIMVYVVNADGHEHTLSLRIRYPQLFQLLHPVGSPGLHGLNYYSAPPHRSSSNSAASGVSTERGCRRVRSRCCQSQSRHQCKQFTFC
jgi:hypothetical protein